MVQDAFDLTGKAAIVTGSGTGLGQAMALGLAEAGADVAGVYNSTPPSVGKAITGLGRRFAAIQADLGHDATATARRIVDETVAALGAVDILVNNAGIIRRADALEFTEKDWDDVLDVNLKSLFFLSQAAAKAMVKQGNGGRIIHVASMLSFQGGIRVPSYTASKSGVLGLTRLMANEWARFGITVNAIAPGYMATANTAPLRNDPERNKQILERIPAGRWGDPDDLKGAVVFLASAAAGYVNGHALAVDGGWLAR
ncbi:MAG: 2-dehydro-3-deoxy-D-gluconate 5-dehydrogenase KduD [Desulfovibrionaceae bacterium]